MTTVDLKAEEQTPAGKPGRIGRKYVAVPRGVITKWQHEPFSAMWDAAQTNVDGLCSVVDPGHDREVEKVDHATREKTTEIVFVAEYPYYVRGASVFRPAGKRDGWNRDDVATLHTQGW